MLCSPQYVIQSETAAPKVVANCSALIVQSLKENKRNEYVMLTHMSSISKNVVCELVNPLETRFKKFVASYR